MPDSKVRRVRKDGFSKNMTSCLPAKVPRKSAGRAFMSAVNSSTASTSPGVKSRTDTRSRDHKPFGLWSSPRPGVLNGWLFIAFSLFLVCAWFVYARASQRALTRIHRVRNLVRESLRQHALFQLCKAEENARRFRGCD